MHGLHDVQAPGSGSLRAHLEVERQHMRQELRELRHDVKKHSLGTAIAGALVGVAAATWGVGPAAVAAVSAYVVYRVLSHHERLEGALATCRDGTTWLTGRCPRCGERVVMQAPREGDYAEMRCSQGHLMHAVVMVSPPVAIRSPM
jgi:hypothetical protein